ncbi:MAG: hypothetical protein HY735_24600 [Verrucomicrobia bacterium]|nr:hypothetical protein [Verrucomicrobiota bacterium]
MRSRRKKQLINKLANYPLLKLVVFDRSFRIALAAGLGLLLAGLALLPKIWVTSPPGFIPVVKVSIFDRIQAWALRRTAQKAMAAGQFDEAGMAWVAAIANNPGNPNLVRGALRGFLGAEHRRRNSDLALQQIFWLLRLTGTNALDLALATEIFEQTQAYGLVSKLLESSRGPLDPNLEARYLKALFHEGKLNDGLSFFESLFTCARMSNGRITCRPSAITWRAAPSWDCCEPLARMVLSEGAPRGYSCSLD